MRRKVSGLMAAALAAAALTGCGSGTTAETTAAPAESTQAASGEIGGAETEAAAAEFSYPMEAGADLLVRADHYRFRKLFQSGRYALWQGLAGADGSGH